MTDRLDIANALGSMKCCSGTAGAECGQDMHRHLTDNAERGGGAEDHIEAFLNFRRHRAKSMNADKNVLRTLVEDLPICCLQTRRTTLLADTARKEQGCRCCSASVDPFGDIVGFGGRLGWHRIPLGCWLRLAPYSPSYPCRALSMPFSSRRRSRSSSSWQCWKQGHHDKEC